MTMPKIVYLEVGNRFKSRTAGVRCKNRGADLVIIGKTVNLFSVFGVIPSHFE